MGEPPEKESADHQGDSDTEAALRELAEHVEGVTGREEKGPAPGGSPAGEAPSKPKVTAVRAARTSDEARSEARKSLALLLTAAKKLDDAMRNLEARAGAVTETGRHTSEAIDAAYRKALAALNATALGAERAARELSETNRKLTARNRELIAAATQFERETRRQEGKFDASVEAIRKVSDARLARFTTLVFVAVVVSILAATCGVAAVLVLILR